MNLDRLQNLLRFGREKRLLVIGDVMLDRFLWGNCSRISPEAPIPVVHVQRESAYPGGAANVARNLLPFAKSVAVLGAVGDDAQADQLIETFQQTGMDASGIIRVPGGQTIVKTRIIARNQQVVRIDRERPENLSQASQEAFIRQWERLLPEIDALIFEDYAKGLLSNELVQSITGSAKAKGICVTVDPNPRNPIAWRGVTAVKPNRSEAFHAAGIPERSIGPDPAADPILTEVSRRLREHWDCQHLLITLAEQGMVLFPREGAPSHFPPRAHEVFDVSGAGDTAIAIFTLALSAGATANEAADLANMASSIVVGKIGTAQVSPNELLEAVRR